MLIFIIPAVAFTSLRAQGKWIQDFEVFTGIGQINNTGNGSYMANSDTKAYWTFGIGANHHFTPLFELYARLGYERKGYKYTEHYYDPYVMENLSREIDWNVHCITLQLLPTGVDSRAVLRKLARQAIQLKIVGLECGKSHNKTDFWDGKRSEKASG